MVHSSLSTPLCGSDGERQKLLQHRASSCDSARRTKDDSYFSYWGSIAVLFILVLGAFYPGFIFNENRNEPYEILATAGYPETGIAACKTSPCFEPSNIHVPLEIPGFPSFLEYAHRGSLSVSYDERSLKLNGERVFFLGGSMHPARATLQTWNLALDEAVENGLNLITIYVMWSDHQPLPNQEIDWAFSDWSLPPTTTTCPETTDDKSCGEWNLASAIRSAANRGLFVHLRIGPYDCAEYSSGGIPEWLLVEKPNMQLRRPNREWLESKSHNQ